MRLDMIVDALVPANIKGKQNDLSTKIVLDNDEQAVERYRTARTRMLSPALWHSLSGALSASFEACNAGGEPVDRKLTMNDLVRIDISGPGTKAGHGYDWVKVDIIQDGNSEDGREDLCGMRLRPTAPPGENGETAHFFQSGASSTFILRRTGNVVSASYHGRNEVPNTHMERTLDNVRNAIITSGALAGLSEAQWMALIKGFIAE
ncbi:MAG: hypothetical protein JSS82_16675 [Bacteroidetes bacterium]|nr:hypothetical protein [Bacteroidota bacterium]